MREVVDRLTRISVRGFKSICTEQRLDIRPLTILAGANSSGKSSIMQPLLLLKQTLESPGDPGALLLDGANVRFTEAEQALSRSSGKDCSAEFAVGMTIGEDMALELVLRREPGKGFDLARMVYRDGQDSAEVVRDMPHDSILEVLPSLWRSMHSDYEKIMGTRLHWAVRRERCFFVLDLAGSGKSPRRMRFGPTAVSLGETFVPHLQGILHLPGLRGNPRRTYPKTAVGPSFQGTFEPYTASVIAQWQANGGSSLLRDLADALRSMGLTWKVKAEPVDDTQVELKVGRLPRAAQGGAHDLVSIADVGFGVSQSLPVVVALLVARPGQIVYLEQPEIHLHPAAQRALAGILKSAADRGVVCVVETHSVLILREVQTLIATGELSKDDVALHWFQRGEDGETTVRTAELDDAGAYGDWPEDFDRTELQSEQAYLDAVEARGAGRVPPSGR